MRQKTIEFDQQKDFAAHDEEVNKAAKNLEDNGSTIVAIHRMVYVKHGVHYITTIIYNEKK